MAIDHRIGTKVIKNLRREDTPATRVEPYPYVGIVKNNLDPTRSGRLQVYIPDLGGDPDNENRWRTVGYASPFMGYTPQTLRSTDRPSQANTFDEVPHTYGMWMVPPDIGVEVIVIFVAGDPNRGYWLACVNSNLSHHMLPGLAGSANIESKIATKYQKNISNKGVLIPTTEYNEYDPIPKPDNFVNNPKPVHTPQFDILRTQGLDRDNVRGSVSSSSQRETPSHVFGISTPGRPSNNPGSNDPARDPNYVSKAEAGLTEDYYQVKSRKGGHTFVMDDGDVLGTDQLVRLRTANGHQIMMHDSAETLYISHSNGNSWIELTKAGTVNVYGRNGIALRSEGPINIHSDKDIVMNAGNDIIFRAGNKINMESLSTNLLTTQLSVETTLKTEFKVGSMAIEAATTSSTVANKIIQVGMVSQNSDPALAVKGVKPLSPNLLPDSKYDETLGVWVNLPAAKSTVVSILPSHEPYYRGAAVAQVNPNAYVPESRWANRDLAETFSSGTKLTEPLDIASEFLGSTLSPDEFVMLARVTLAEASSNPQEIAQVAGVILNRVRSSKYPNDLYSVVQQKGQFQVVTGRYINGNYTGPEGSFATGTLSSTELDRFTKAITEHLPTANKQWLNFTAADAAAYGTGTNIEFRNKLIAQGGVIIGKSVFGTV